MTLTTTSQNKLTKQVAGDLNRHEGFREYAYPDPLSPLMKKYPSKDWGFKPAKEILAKLGVPLDRAAKEGAPWTVGHGFTGSTTLDSRMDRITSDRKLEQKILEVDSALSNVLTWYKDASFVTKTVLINMSFNIGIKGLLGFSNTLKFISQKNYEQAARNMTQSLWAKQVGGRAKELVERMRTQEISPGYTI
jgi:GH24 family phage-related lysozyme (muramidase)